MFSVMKGEEREEEAKSVKRNTSFQTLYQIRIECVLQSLRSLLFRDWFWQTIPIAASCNPIML